MAFTEDKAQFIAESDFAVPAIYNGATPISVICDTQYERLNLGTGGVESRGLAALAVSEAVPNAVQGDTLVIDAVTYVVNEVQPDPPEGGPGFTLLLLEKQ